MTILKGVNVHSNGRASPRKMYETMVADTVENSSGIMEVMEMLNSRISNVNRTPASGALNMPATAPAAPQPRSMVMFL